MDASDDSDFTNCHDMTDSDIEEFNDDDDEQNLNPLLSDELEFLLLRMLELVEECYTNLMHHSIMRTPIPQRTSILTGSMWVHWVIEVLDGSVIDRTMPVLEHTNANYASKCPNLGT
jgi:hypothetical protein